MPDQTPRHLPLSSSSSSCGSVSELSAVDTFRKSETEFDLVVATIDSLDGVLTGVGSECNKSNVEDCCSDTLQLVPRLACCYKSIIWQMIILTLI